MSRALCTLAVGPALELLELSGPTMEAYAERHGFEFVVRRELDSDLGAPWAKLGIVGELLKDHDEVLWVDCDAMIVDSERDVFADLPGDRGVGLVMHTWENALLPNTGLLALRPLPATFEIIDRAVGLSQRYAKHPWWEQAAIMDVLGFETVDTRALMALRSPSQLMVNVRFLGKEWNSLAFDQAPWPRIKHYAGMAQASRLRAMRWDADAMAQRDIEPNFAVSIVLVTGDSEPADVLRCLESIAAIDHISVQTVIIAPPAGPLDPILAALEGDVRIVRTDGAPDFSLVGGLSAATGSVALVLPEPVTVTMTALEPLYTTATTEGVDAAVLRYDDVNMIAVRRGVLPPTAWVGGMAGAEKEADLPLVRALQRLRRVLVDIVAGAPVPLWA
jgi:hypothetical protein